MAEALQIPGPCVVQWRAMASSPGAFATLGRWDNDAPARWSQELRDREVTTNTSGETPEELIVRGITGRLQFVLVKWDTTQILAMNKISIGSGQTAGWRFPVVGATLVGTVAAPTGGLVEIKINPVLPNRPTYTFSYLRMRPVDLDPYGNQPLNLGLSFMLCRPSDASETTDYITVA